MNPVESLENTQEVVVKFYPPYIPPNKLRRFKVTLECSGARIEGITLRFPLSGGSFSLTYSKNLHFDEAHKTFIRKTVDAAMKAIIRKKDTRDIETLRQLGLLISKAQWESCLRQASLN